MDIVGRLELKLKVRNAVKRVHVHVASLKFLINDHVCLCDANKSTSGPIIPVAQFK